VKQGLQIGVVNIEMEQHPRYNKDLDEHKDFILQALEKGSSVSAIVSELAATHQVATTRKTLQRRLKKWQVPNRQERTKPSDELDKAIRYYFFDLGLRDVEMLPLLKAEGFVITVYGLQQRRRSMGLYHNHNANQLETRIAALRQFFETPTASTDQVPTMSRRWLKIHIRQAAKINFPEAKLFAMVKELYPRNLEDRLERMRRPPRSLLT
jgi:hypothetical protein